jgi:XRE family transcriptional regulator, master regulator for biofilm formation
MMMVGEKIKRLRNRKKYSITELSLKANVSKSYLSYIERGIQVNPSLQVLSRLARTLDTTVEYLTGNESLLKKEEVPLDPEWLLLMNEAIEYGVSKEDFSYYLDFVKFKNSSSRNNE